MKIAWNYILIAAMTLASAAVIAGGEVARGELGLAEAATAAGSTSDAFAWLNEAPSPATSSVQ